MQTGSKRFSLKFRLIRPFLGQRRLQGNVRGLDTSTEGDELFFLPDVVQWRWALKEAMDSLGILEETNVDYVRLPSKIKSPAIRLYSRVWSAKDPGKRETFQCFQAGTLLTVPMFILNSLEDAGSIRIEQRPPTVTEVTECFRVIGSDIGLSPWGSKFGHGRFTIEPND